MGYRKLRAHFAKAVRSSRRAWMLLALAEVACTSEKDANPGSGGDAGGVFDAATDSASAAPGADSNPHPGDADLLPDSQRDGAMADASKVADAAAADAAAADAAVTDAAQYDAESEADAASAYLTLDNGGLIATDCALLVPDFAAPGAIACFNVAPDRAGTVACFPDFPQTFRSVVVCVERDECEWDQQKWVPEHCCARSGRLTTTLYCAEIRSMTFLSIGVYRDRDGDFFGDVVDNCPEANNFDQEDADQDGLGDACDS